METVVFVKMDSNQILINNLGHVCEFDLSALETQSTQQMDTAVSTVLHQLWLTLQTLSVLLSVMD